ncbi:pre-mRNA-processing factor 39-like isoform X1 [Bufo gargarizans]|uniref:pre-mRNA-processing factor 39-like isoform X1 n=1 Tax=Bufo gargarizans TaxID=30331 RepID=UPI001CF49FD1|nr:pre-mRNA-processing factor 39-like isoform X1 [Bufo gargarizans]
MADRRRFQAGFSAGSLFSSSQSSQDCDVLTTEDCSGSDEDETKDSDMVGMPPAFRSYWKAAITKPSNFTAWTKLVAYSEKEKHLAACRKAFDAFLTYFPLSHIYWKKYADIEQHFGIVEEVEKIFTRAVKSNPLNVALWTSYILFLLKKVNTKLPNSDEKLRGLYVYRVFKEAVDACGMEFHSDDFWSLYIEYEIKHNNFKEAVALYDRVLNIPTQQYEMHFERFKILVSSRSPAEYLTTEEIIAIHLKIQTENYHDQIAVEDLPSDDITDSLSETDLQNIRQHLLDTRKQMYLLNEIQVKKRSTFEEGIKRLYFFASPVNVKQLRNWRKYLDFERSEGQHERIVMLYERCLMPCAMYEEFWLSYAKYMEEHSVEAARSVFERACRIHLPLKFTLHLQWALFEEKLGQLDSARAIMCNLEKVLPGVVMVRLRRVNFERRNGNLQEAERLLSEAVQNSSGTEMATFYAVKLSRLLLKLKKDPEKARDVLVDALKKDPNSPYLHQCLLEVEMARDDVDSVMHCVKRALNSNIHDAIKGILSQRRLEFLEDCGDNIKSLLNAYDEHQTLLEQEEFKRKAVHDENEEEKKKKAKTQSDSASVEDNISTSGIMPHAAASEAPLSSNQSVSTTNTTESSTPQTIVNTPKSTNYVQYKPTPSPRGKVPVPRPTVRPYIPPHRAPIPPLMPSFFGGSVPPPRLSFPPPIPPVPPYTYGPWMQNYMGYRSPQPWNYNRFYTPF